MLELTQLWTQAALRPPREAAPPRRRLGAGPPQEGAANLEPCLCLEAESGLSSEEGMDGALLTPGL